MVSRAEKEGEVNNIKSLGKEDMKRSEDSVILLIYITIFSLLSLVCIYIIACSLLEVFEIVSQG